MSLLREVVDEANKLRTQRITLREGKRPSFFTIKGAVEPRKFDPLTPADIDQLFGSIFAGAGDLLRHQRHSRKFKILELGEVDCIGLTDLRQINIYLARGAALYTLDYAQFFHKSSVDDKQGQMASDAEQQEQEGESASFSSTSNSMIDAMVSFVDKPVASQKDAADNPPSDQPSTPAPALPQSGTSDSGKPEFSLDIPSISNNPAAAPQPNTSAPASGTAPVRGVFQAPSLSDKPAAAPQLASPSVSPQEKNGTDVFQSAVPLKAEGDVLAAAVSPEQERGAAPPADVSDMLHGQTAGTAGPEETGVHTSMHRVAKQIDQVVTESAAITEDGKSQFTAPAQAQADRHIPPAHTLTGTSVVSEGDQAIDELLREMMTQEASDLHLSCNHPVMMRIGGQLEKVKASDNITPETLHSWLTPITPAAGAVRLAQSGDVNFTYELKDVGRFRVNVLKDLRGIGAVLRYVPAVLKTLEELDAPEIVRKFCYLSKGLVIINGPAGSGRSTTMAAMIDTINSTRKAHLLSIEDPIEFVHAQKNSLIRQREVGTHTGSVQEGLRAALREDPDVICTGELSDAAVMSMAMKYAEAGRLVYSMMHTRNSVSAIDSIINQFTPAHQNQARHLLANTLRGVICQILVREKSGGQVAAWEALIVSDEAAAMIKTGRTQQLTAHMIAHRVKGNILLNDSLLKLVNEGTVSFNNAITAAADKRALHALAYRRGIKLSA